MGFIKTVLRRKNRAAGVIHTNCPVMIDTVIKGKKPYFKPSYTATAQATVAPTMGLLPMPIRPIIST